MATVADAGAVSALVERAYGHWVPKLGGRPRPMDDDYAEVFAESSEYEGWVSAEGDAIRGVIVLQPEADHLWIDNVAVDPSAASVGLGKALLVQAAERARELGLPEIWLFTHERMDTNLAIYRALGWTEFEPDERVADYFVYFRKRVGP